MKMSNILYISIILIILYGMIPVHAEITTIKAVKVNNCINLPQIEYNSSFQNLTFVHKPNGVNVVIGKLMNKNGYSYNYTFCDTSLTGTYTANGCSDLSCWNYEFNITPSGNSDNNSYYFLLIGIIYIVAFVGFFGKNEIIAMFGGMAMIALGIYTINNGVIIFRDFITDVFSWTTIGLGAFFIILAGMSLIQETTS